LGVATAGEDTASSGKRQERTDLADVELGFQGRLMLRGKKIELP